MKFENPIMNISMFEVENVVTTSGGGSDTPAIPDAQNAAAAANGIKDVSKVITISF